MRENLKEWITALLWAGAVAVIVIQFVIPTTVDGRSMEPTFEHNEYLLISKQSYLGRRQPANGDVVVFNSRLKDEKGEYKKLIKRVIGVPGDTIAVTDGNVYINGEKLQEDYIKDGVTNGDVGPVIVPEGSVFCMGDNRLHSTDSRFLEVGFVSQKEIVGKVVFRVYPFNKFGKIGSPQ